ncbi:unnamed protein product [Schistocephalus solidus]|uniref:Uncharacterized protein n=1 Tax=Schistocephalus solidus TaxID=70667 RepID=A0A3P7DM79_SCHSO|nr:unnamed protein product [Schistocephalus solidus]
MPETDRETLRCLCRKHMATTLQVILTERASFTNPFTLSPNRVILLASLLTIELELNSRDQGAGSDRVSFSDKGGLTFKRFVGALPLQDSRTSEERAAVGALLHALLEISMTGLDESAYTEEDKGSEAGAGILTLLCKTFACKNAAYLHYILRHMRTFLVSAVRTR